jgi:hypothetical protein
MAGRHVPPDFAAGDESTLGGYAAVHARPPAFEGTDGMSYSVEIVTDETGDRGAPWGAYLLFVKWRRVGASSPEGHLETDYLASGATEAEVAASLGGWPLLDVKHELDTLVAERHGGAAPTRRWWDVMRAEAEDAS